MTISNGIHIKIKCNTHHQNERNLIQWLRFIIKSSLCLQENIEEGSRDQHPLADQLSLTNIEEGSHDNLPCVN